MGCTSSHFLEDDDQFCTQMGGPSALGHHIVSLTSTTYGLLNLDSPKRAEPVRPVHSLFPPPLPEPRCLSTEPEIINSWELMAGLDNDSFRFSPFNNGSGNKENRDPSNRSVSFASRIGAACVLKPLNSIMGTPKFSLEGFEKRCPPGGENAMVIYTTTLRGIRKTFEDCNAVRTALEGVGVWVRERDVSMHLGFRQELQELLKGKTETTVPRVFVKGRYIGGVDEVMRIHEEGGLGKLVEGLPRRRAGAVCGGCGGARFLPCFTCYGSSKRRMEDGGKAVKCPDCNENGLVLCPLCT